MDKPRLLLVDDHELFLDGLRKLLEPDFEVVGAAGDGRAAVAAYMRYSPDLMLVDIGLPLLNGIEAARQVRHLVPEAMILFVTMQTDRIYVEEAFRAGGAGYVVKQAAARELVKAIHEVLDGRYYLSPVIAEKMKDIPSDLAKPSRHSAHLTPRQREVLQLVAEGKSMKEIAEILEISVRTVEFHKGGIMQELGCRSTAELTRYAIEHGIISV
ncbi:MAG TPA: response regulator transcription factor [Bryobacteraceae bacterium]